jgi:hypothetical protein
VDILLRVLKPTSDEIMFTELQNQNFQSVDWKYKFLRTTTGDTDYTGSNKGLEIHTPGEHPLVQLR